MKRGWLVVEILSKLWKKSQNGTWSKASFSPPRLRRVCYYVSIHCFPLNQVCVHCWLTLLWIPTMVVATPTKKAQVIQLWKLNWTYEKIGKELSFDKSTAQCAAKDYSRYYSYYHRKGKPGHPKKLSEYDALLAVQRIRSGQARDASDL